MSKVGVLAKLRAKEGKRDEMAAAIASVIDGINAESGCVYYILHTHDGDPNLLVFYEMYQDQAAFEAHGKGETLKSLGPLIGPLLDGRPELEMLTPVAGKGL